LIGFLMAENLETVALLKLLAIGDQDITAGHTRPARDILMRLRNKRPERRASENMDRP
jgi:hypothetical protein